MSRRRRGLTFLQIRAGAGGRWARNCATAGREGGWEDDGSMMMQAAVGRGWQRSNEWKWTSLQRLALLAGRQKRDDASSDSSPRRLPCPSFFARECDCDITRVIPFKMARPRRAHPACRPSHSSHNPPRPPHAGCSALLAVPVPAGEAMERPASVCLSLSLPMAGTFAAQRTRTRVREREGERER